MTRASWRSRLFGFGLLVAVGCRPSPATYRDVVVDISDTPVGELVAGVVVEQTFVPNHDRLSGVAILLATYGGRARGCHVVFRLRAPGSRNDIAKQTRDCAAIADNSWVRFDFDPLPATRGQRLLFQLESPDGRTGQAVTAWMSSVPDVYADGALTVNGAPVKGSLRFTTYHR
jgi:hypothetical protein